MNKLLPILLALLPVALSAAPDSDKQYFSCRSCHGDKGLGSAAIHAPALAGQSADYLARQLRHFRNGTRGAHPQDKWGKQMALMAANLDESQVDQLALLIAAMPPWPVATSAMPQNPAGAQLFATCTACHGKSGEGKLETNAPRISSMDSVYLATQLRNFRDGIRGAQENDIPGGQMRAAIPPSLDDDAIDQLARYLEAL